MQNNCSPDSQAPNGVIATTGFAMHALKDLFTTDVGLMSVAGIAFMLGMGVFFVRYFLRHIREDAEAAAAASKR